MFLFTDLEGSTRLWEQHPVAMQGALARHDAILREAVAAAGGAVVKSTGDGLMAVFPAVADCLAACLAAQRALAACEWETGEPLRVRMGVNAGDAEARAGDYYGTEVNRAARIMSAGHGGQVLVSETVAARATGELPEGAGLRDLGRHRLKDLTEPQHLFQLVHPDLAGEFPPLATLDARPNNLPIQVSAFFGRAAEQQALRSLLADPAVRLITLTGPGGIGKTRLGLQVAADLVDRYRDGVYFVDLSAEREPDAAFEAMLRELGLAAGREGAPLQVLKAKLRDRRLLMLLDNFEQVTGAAVGVAELLASCPGVEVVATSREALRLRGERVLAVSPLPAPDPRSPLAVIASSEAVGLFVERARAVRPDFALTADNAAAVAEIADRLDGLPLALELAAAKLKVFGPGELRDRLRGRVDILGSGARDLPARQRTLRGAIEWSYDLLEPDERRVFEALSVFSTARLDAIEEVVGAACPEVDSLESVASLVDKSLVRSGEAGGARRFSMLQTIREFAAERLRAVPEVEAAVRLAHARHYTDLAGGFRSALEGGAAGGALAELTTEIGNLRAAWRFWVEAGDLGQLNLLLDGLWTLHDARGWYHGAAELASDLLVVLATADPSPQRDEEEMTLRTSLGRALMTIRGYTPEVEREFVRARELATSLGGAVPSTTVLRALASYYMNTADFGETAVIGRRLLDLAERERDDAGLVEGHLVFGLGTAFTGNTEAGIGHLDRAIELFDRHPHRPARYRLGTSPGVVARIASALLLRMGGFPDQAGIRATAALDLARRLDHPYTLSYALYHVGFLELNRRRWEAARGRAAELAAVAGEAGYSVWQALASVLEGVARCALGEPEEGLALAEAGNDLYSGLTTPPVFWPPLLALRGLGFALAGHPQRALELVDEAIRLAGSDAAQAAEFEVIRGDICSMLGDQVAAEEAYRTALAAARGFGVRLVELGAAARLVALLRSQGRSPEGADELAALYATFTEGFDEPDLVMARDLLGPTA